MSFKKFQTSYLSFKFKMICKILGQKAVSVSLDLNNRKKGGGLNIHFADSESLKMHCNILPYTISIN